MKNKLFLTTIMAYSLTCAGIPFPHAAFAEETAGEKVQNAGDDAVKDTKKAGRKVKRTARDATGNSSTKENIKDSVNNTGDDISTEAKKAKRKAD